MDDQDKLDCLDELDNIINTELSINSSRVRANVKAACSTEEKRSGIVFSRYKSAFSSNIGYIAILVLIFVITTISSVILKSGSNTPATSISQTQKAIVTCEPVPSDQVVYIDIPTPTPTTTIDKKLDTLPPNTNVIESLNIDLNNIKDINFYKSDMFKHVSKSDDYNQVAQLLNQFKFSKADGYDEFALYDYPSLPDYTIVLRYKNVTDNLIIVVRGDSVLINGVHYKPNNIMKDLDEFYNRFNYSTISDQNSVADAEEQASGTFAFQPKITKEEAIRISYEKNRPNTTGIPARYSEPAKNAELKFYTKHPAVNVNSDKYVWVVEINYYNPDYNPPTVSYGIHDLVDAQTGEILFHDTSGGVWSYPTPTTQN